MSVQEIEAAARGFFEAFTQLDVEKAIGMLSEDLEVIDHVPYRFDSKAEFAEFLRGAMAGVTAASGGLRQLSCRTIGEGAGVANGYDTFTSVGPNGQANTLNGRTTLVFGKEDGQWKIVSAHFSPLPTH